MSDIAAQRARLEQLKAQLDQEYAKDQPNAETVNATIAEMNKIEQDLATAAQTEQIAEQINQNHEDRVVQATDELSSIIDNIDVGEGLTLRNYFDNESDYQFVTSEIKRSVSAKLAAFSETIKGYEEREVQAQRQNSILQTQVTTLQGIVDVGKPENGRLTRENGDLRDHTAKLSVEKADLESKLTNATNELDKAKSEIESLTAQLAAKTKPAEATPELTEEERQKRILQKKAEITVYNVRPNRELNPTEFTATLAATGKDITYNWTQKNRYIEVDEPTALQFRTEYEAATKVEPVAPNAHDNIPLAQSVEPVADVSQFPSETVPAPANHPEVVGQADQTVVSRTEFAALEARVTALEGKQIAQVA